MEICISVAEQAALGVCRVTACIEKIVENAQNSPDTVNRIRKLFCESVSEKITSDMFSLIRPQASLEGSISSSFRFARVNFYEIFRDEWWTAFIIKIEIQ